MTITDIENKIKQKMDYFDFNLDEEFKSLILGYISIFHKVYEEQRNEIERLEEKDYQKQEVAVKLTELCLDAEYKYLSSKEKVLENYNFFLNSMTKKSPQIDEIEFKAINE